MIEVIIKRSGTLINKPIIHVVHLNEDEVAMEIQNPDTEKYEKKTVGELFEAFRQKGVYETHKNSTEHIKPIFLDMWFREKYLKTYSNIISVQYKKI